MFVMLNLQYLHVGIILLQNTCRMSDNLSLRRICKKDLGMKDFLYTLTVLVVYVMVSLQYLGIIPRQNTCRLIYGFRVFHEYVVGIFPKSDLAH